MRWRPAAPYCPSELPDIMSAAPADPLPSFFMASQASALPLYTVAQLRQIEQHATQDLPEHTLMQRAGTAAADFLAQRYRSAPAGTIWLAAGPGNNGGDALVAATELCRRGIAVEVFLPVEPQPADARWALAGARATGVRISPEWSGSCDAQGYGWCVDGLFGIGLGRPLDGIFAAVAQQLTLRAQTHGRVLALDVPSGLNSDTGTLPPTRQTVSATDTLSFIGAKPGLYTGHGQDTSGTVWVAPLGLPLSLPISTEGAAPHPLWLNTPAVFESALPRRDHATHKGSFGTLAVVGGATGMVGAPILSARAALYAGAGKVHVALLSDQAPAYDPPHPELMLHPGATPPWADISAIAAGPGLSQSPGARDWLAHILEQAVPTVLDADALNLIAAHETLAAQLAKQGQLVVMTPHPLECARLLKTDTTAIQNDRIKAARALAHHYGCVAVLKGSGTIVARPDGMAWVNPTGNAGLATGGTGDVLSGLIGAFLAQRCEPHLAALAAVYLHGLAAQQLSAQGCGPAGLTAGELAPVVRTLLNHLCYRTAGRGAGERGTADE
jgi:ADP-dependent NAD(P)H-hydrate dehydratase / NAD(P)H-hydrate epimerase